jgi:xylulokinase
MSLLLGIDIGTSATKALLINERGTIVASASRDYPLYAPKPGWSEQEPQDWWLATAAAVRELLSRPGISAADVAGVSFSGQMHGSVLLGGDAASSGGQAAPLRRALLWNDQRTARECEIIEAELGGRRAMVQKVGNAALTGFTLPKLLWVREHEPDIWAQVRHFMLPKDFVRFRLTGEIATDVGDASGTLLFDVDKREWYAPAAKEVKIDIGLLPRVLESAVLAGHVTAWAAEQTGLREGTPVIAGTGDNMAGAVGAGVVEDGMVLAVLGTSGVILAHSGRPYRDIKDPNVCGRVHTMCAATSRHSTSEHMPAASAWCLTGCTLCAGGALQWARNTLAPGVSYDQLMQEAAGAPAGCEGLVFLPYLTGERCPHPDPAARGAFVGLTTRHTRGHLFRAVIEGVTFNMAAILDIMRSVGVPVQTVRLSGGGNRSALWRQMQADCYGTSVVMTNSDEGGSALGAALLAGVGVGVWPTVQAACRGTIAVRETLGPSRERHQYHAPRQIFSELYRDLSPRFVELGRNGDAKPQGSSGP